MSELKVNSVVDAAGGNTASINGYTPTMSNMAGKNRIINGDMRIDQRNAGASVSGTSGVFSVDRWKVQNNSGSARFNIQQNAGSVTPPAGFTKYLGVTSTGAYAVAAGDVISIVQSIEGYNISDFGWGAAGAIPVTLSFWVRSSLTGTFGGSVKAAGATSYPFTYTISAANTWEYKTVAISGPTSGTFATDNTTGIEIYWSMGTGSTFNGTTGSWASADYRSATGATSIVGTNGATFYITGVQLEAGSVATPFERRPYGTELALCQRYYEKSYDMTLTAGSTTGGGTFRVNGSTDESSNMLQTFRFAVVKRATPTMTYYNSDTGAVNNWYYRTSSSGVASGTPNTWGSGTGGSGVYVTTNGAFLVGYAYGQWIASAEL